MVLDITNCLELQQLFLLDADSEAGVGFDQDFVKPQGVNPNVLHQPRFGSDHCWISAGNAMQDLDKAPLQLLLIGSSLAQRHQPFNPAKVPVFLRLLPAPVPAELLVDRLVVNVDEKGEAILRQA